MDTRKPGPNGTGSQSDTDPDRAGRSGRAVEAESLLAAVLANSRDAIVIRGEDGKIVYWNAAAEQMFGYSQDALGQDALMLVPSERIEESRKNRVLNNSGQGSLDLETVRVTKDGRRIDVSLRVSPIKNANGAVWGASLVFRDISARKLDEQSQARLAAIVQSSNDAIISRSLEGIILSWNSGAEKMLGYTEAESIGRYIRRTLPPEMESVIREQNRRILNGEVFRDEMQRITKDGRIIDVASSHSPIRDSAGNITGVSIILQDITARKLAELNRLSLEAQLRESQKMEAIGTLAGGIAHDFNNALAIILGNMELARLDSRNNPAALESLEEIRKAGSRARDLVQQILAFSRRQPAECKPIPLAPIVEESARLLRSTLPARIALEVQCQSGVPPVMANATQMQQVLINLANNAMQAIGPAPGRIQILLDTVVLNRSLVGANPSLRNFHEKHPGSTVRLTINDTGTGMDSATQQRIFEPFFTTKPTGEGTGLGLSVVHGIMQSHDGAIGVSSEPGKGASFHLHLPPVAPPAGPPPEPGADPIEAREPNAIAMAADGATAAPAGHHILYLDDEPVLVSLVKRQLERRGHRVSAHVDQEQALEALRADPAGFDLLVSDFNMPGMSGVDVALAAREIRADLPVVIASGFVDDLLQRRAREVGVHEVIFKADAMESFCDVILRLLNEVRSSSEPS